MTNREGYMNQLHEDETIQALDIGTGFDFTKPVKNKKAEVIINALKGCHIGYKLDYKNLACKRFKKWVEGAAWFKTGDMLSPSDIKMAVREFYRLVATGELGWSDGTKKMLEFTRLIDGTMELKVTTFIPGLYRDTSKEAKGKEEAESIQSEAEMPEAVEADGIDVMGTLEAILKENISEIEREIVGKAMASLILANEKTA